MSAVAKGIVLALGCLVLLGTMPVISNSRPAGITPLVFAFALSVWQVIIAVPVVAVELRGLNKGIFGIRLAAQERLRMIAVALLTGAIFGLTTYLYVLGVERAGATNAAIAIQSYPLFAILWESLFLKRRKTGMELALTFLMICALYYLGTGGTLRMSGLSVWFVISLSVPFLWSIAHVIIKEELGRTPITPAQVTFFRVTISTLFLAALLVVVAPTQDFTLAIDAILLPAALFMGLVYYLELVTWFYAVRHIDVSLASSITTPWPALTMVLAAIFLGDPIAPYQVGALIVVVLCIYGLTLASLRRVAAGKASGAGFEAIGTEPDRIRTQTPAPGPSIREPTPPL